MAVSVVIAVLFFWESGYETVTLSKPRNVLVLDRRHTFSLSLESRFTVLKLAEVTAVNIAKKGFVDIPYYVLVFTFVNGLKVKVL